VERYGARHDFSPHDVVADIATRNPHQYSNVTTAKPSRMVSTNTAANRQSNDIASFLDMSITIKRRE
jgi:hypothetical protein